MAGGDELLLDVHGISKQLSHGAAIAIGIDAADGDGLPFQVATQIVPCSFRWNQISIAPLELWRIDARQPDLLSSGAGAGVPVATGGDQNRNKGSKQH